MTPAQASDKVENLAKEFIEQGIEFTIIAVIKDEELGGYHDVVRTKTYDVNILHALAAQVKDLVNNSALGGAFGKALLNQLKETNLQHHFKNRR